MVGRLQPLVDNQRIVRTDGTPTEYFIRWAQQRQIDIENAVSEERAIEIITEFFNDNPLLAGSGIDLSPSGNILDGVTISAEVQAILNQISTVQGSVLFRGAADWEALAPGTAGYVLSTNGAAADPTWIAQSGGGGGGGYPSLVYPVAANFPTLINSPTIVDSGSGFSLTGAAAATAVRAALKALPVGDFTVTARMTGEYGINFNGGGIVFRDTGGRYIVCGPLNATGGFAEISQFTNSTTFSAGAAGFRDLDNANFPEWIRASFTSSTSDVSAEVSWDGLNWLSIGTSTWLGTADAVGLGGSFRNVSRAAWLSFTSYQEA